MKLGTWKRLSAVAAALSLGGAGALAAPAARAQEGFAVELFEPRPELGRALLSVGTSDLPPQWGLTVGLVLHHEDDPVTLVDPNDRERLLERVVDERLTGEVMGAVGLTDWLSLGLALPLVLAQLGTDLAPLGLDGEAGGGLALGDLRLVPTFRLLGGGDGLGLTVGAVVSLPTGDSARLAGDGALRLRPQVGIDYAASGFRVALEVGYELRSERRAATYVSDDMIRWGLGGRIPIVGEMLDALVVTQGTIQTAAGVDPIDPERDLRDAPTVSLEAIGALELELGGSLVVSAGGGTSLAYAVGSPDVRAFFAIGWGSVGDRGEAPASEDVQDEVSAAPRDADLDGVADAHDRCPREAEDKDGFSDEDGCPDADNDADGVADVADECPDAAEDKDGFSDADGCPDADNDADGVADVADECPDAAEDADGFSDEDGCPDPDNDGDGVMDASDTCPDRAEILNGVDDQDGCPDTDDPDITLTADAIVFKGRINFPTQSDRILESSFGLLGRIAKLLREHTYLTKVRVEGYTDSQGWDHVNLEVSQQRAAAVMRFLVEKGGVAAERLVSEGYGEANPIFPNDTPGGRWRNRRIELKILEINGRPVAAPADAP